MLGSVLLQPLLPPSPSSSTVVIYSLVIVRTQLRLGPLADQKDEKEKSFINATVVIGSQTPLLVYIWISTFAIESSEVYSLPSMSRCTYDNNLSRIYVHIPSWSITGKAINCPHRCCKSGTCVDCSLPMSLPLLLDIDIDTSGIDDRLWQVRPAFHARRHSRSHQKKVRILSMLSFNPSAMLVKYMRRGSVSM